MGPLAQSTKKGQETLKSFALYSKCIIMNEMCFVESKSLLSLFPIITKLAFSMVVHTRLQETQPKCANYVTGLVLVKWVLVKMELCTSTPPSQSSDQNASDINKIYDISFYCYSEY